MVEAPLATHQPKNPTESDMQPYAIPPQVASPMPAFVNGKPAITVCVVAVVELLNVPLIENPKDTTPALYSK